MYTHAGSLDDKTDHLQAPVAERVLTVRRDLETGSNRELTSGEMLTGENTPGLSHRSETILA